MTLQQLLTHQSGIPDFGRFPAFIEKNAEGKQFEELPHETWEFLQMIAGQPLDFEPGTSEAYSNTNYTLIKEIIRTLTKMAPEEYLNTELFQPLGMNDTRAVAQGRWPELRQQKELQNLLKPLRYDPTTPSNEIYLTTYLTDAAGSGQIQIISTALDLLRWNLALHRDYRVLPKELYGFMVAPYSKGPSGNGYGFGFGIAMDKTRFGIAYNHASGSTQIIYIPSQDLSFIVLTHVSYDWDRVEPQLQEIKRTLEAKGEKSEVAEQKAVQAILQKYPLENRGFEAIISIINTFIGIT